MKKEKKKNTKTIKIIDLKSRIQFTLLFYVFFVAFLSLSLDKLLVSKIGRLPEAYPITAADNYKAYFELSANKTSLAKDEQVNIVVKVATTGEEFNAGVAIVEWDTNEFEFVNSKKGNPPGGEDGISSFTGGSQGKRIVALYIPQTDPPLQNMTTTRGKLTRFYTIVLKSKVDNPSSKIKLASSNLLVLHFVGSGVTNSVDQSLADQSKLEIGFSPEQSPSPPPSPSSSPSSSPPPSPSPTPGPETEMRLKIKLDGVPANDNNINLLDIYKEIEVLVAFDTKSDSGIIGYWEGKMSFEYDPETKTYSVVNEAFSDNINILLKGSSHRKIRFCKAEGQTREYVCRRNEYIDVKSFEDYLFDFTGHPLEFGDVDWDGSVGVQDYSFIISCKKADAKVGQEAYDIEDGCNLADGNFDGVVDSTDVVLILKTLSSYPDDE